MLHGHAEERQCVWTSSLELSLDATSGRFLQQTQVDLPTWATLPGDATHWPQGVSVDRASALVVDHEGTPQVRLTPGVHVVEGSFVWDAPPDSMPIPEETALVGLTLRGRRVSFPGRDDRGHLWLQPLDDDEAARAEDRLDLVVHRRVDDGVPLWMVTRLELDVAGKKREVLLGPVVPSPFEITAVESPVPARVETGGLLRVQLRPGHWTVVLRSRAASNPTELAAPKTREPWPAEEVWTFAADPRTRLVTIEDGVAIDPQQTTLPTDWRVLPTYRMGRNDHWRIVEQRRGGGDGGTDELSVQRLLWLDFDGHGYTIRDTLQGQLRRTRRLEMDPPMTLGRVAMNGTDQLITRLDTSGRTGVEVRQPNVNAVVDLRYEGSRGALPAVGWRHDLQSLSAELRLPPGWQLFHAGGVDEAPGSWLNRWTLFDLFFLVIFTLAAAKLWGPSVGAVALVAMTLTLSEREAPTALWLPLLAIEALRRVLPAGLFLRIADVGRWALAVALVALVTPFAVRELRVGLYPALERADVVLGESGSGLSDGFASSAAEREGSGGISLGVLGSRSAPPMAPGAVEQKKIDRDQDAVQDEVEQKVANLRVPAPSQQVLRRYKGRTTLYGASSQRNRMEHDPNAVVQTGPGLPSWQWGQAALRWNGPVAHDQRLSLWLIPPWANLALALLRVGALAALLFVVLRSPRNRRVVPSPRPGVTSVVWLTLLAMLSGGATLLGPEGSARADWPSQELLDTLKTRLLEPPSCAPQCASSSRLWLEANPTTLTARWEVSAAAATAVPLPASPKHWLPARVVVDGKPGVGLFRDDADQLWLRLDPGHHEVLLEGPLPPRETVQIPLPLKPHRVDSRLQGWTLEGVHEDGVADDSLQLTRAAVAEPSDAPTLQPSTLAPFVEVERTLHFGLAWEVDTRVRRLTPPGTAVVFELPLLSGESVTTADVRVADGRVQVNLGPNDDGTSWRSVLQAQPALALQAPTSTTVVEVWKIDASALWHVELTGVPAIAPGSTSEGALPEYHPWPGERLQVALRRPASAGGQTATIDKSIVTVHPGGRVTGVELELLLRSSRGGQHPLLLPLGAEVQSVRVDGRPQPLRPEAGVLLLPLRPGSQHFIIRWRQPGGSSSRLRTPRLKLGLPVVNAEVQVKLGRDRWPLLLGGDGVGPAVLFWGVLMVLATAAVGLASIEWVPLRAAHWFLLGLGLTQVSLPAALVVVGWFLAMGWRRSHLPGRPRWQFVTVQVALVVWAIAACAILLDAVQHGLLLEPDMQIAGNGSSSEVLRWFRDRGGDELPRAWVLSVPRTVYRLLMLSWALWLAARMLHWARWAWRCFSRGGLLRPSTEPGCPPSTPGAAAGGAVGGGAAGGPMGGGVVSGGVVGGMGSGPSLGGAPAAAPPMAKTMPHAIVAATPRATGGLPTAVATPPVTETMTATATATTVGAAPPEDAFDPSEFADPDSMMTTTQLPMPPALLPTPDDKDP
jgi:hypothetical protein